MPSEAVATAFLLAAHNYPSKSCNIRAVQVGRYFNLREFTDSETAARHGLPNDPGAAEFEALRLLCAKVLDPLRERLGRSITITSGYRSPEVNRLVGGSRSSQHCAGEAADIKVVGLSTSQVFEFIRASGLPYDQVIYEFGQWVHVSYSARQSRRQDLVAIKFKGQTRYDSVTTPPQTQSIKIPPAPIQASAAPASVVAVTPSASVPVAPPVESHWHEENASRPFDSRIDRIDETQTIENYAAIKQEQFIRPLSIAQRIHDALLGSGKKSTQWASLALLAWPLWNQIAEAAVNAGITLPTKGQWITLAVAVGRLLIQRGKQ